MFSTCQYENTTTNLAVHETMTYIPTNRKIIFQFSDNSFDNDLT